MRTEKVNQGNGIYNITCTGMFPDGRQYEAAFTEERGTVTNTYLGINGLRQRPSENRRVIAAIARAHRVNWK